MVTDHVAKPLRVLADDEAKIRRRVQIKNFRDAARGRMTVPRAGSPEGRFPLGRVHIRAPLQVGGAFLVNAVNGLSLGLSQFQRANMVSRIVVSAADP